MGKVLQSNRIVHLDNTGEVIWEEWPNPSDKIMEGEAIVLHREWIRKANKTSRLPITASIVGPAAPEQCGGFGYDLSLIPRGRHYRRFGVK